MIMNLVEINLKIYFVPLGVYKLVLPGNETNFPPHKSPFTADKYKGYNNRGEK